MSENKIKDNNEILLPVLVTRGLVCFPHNDVMVDIGRQKTINAVLFAQSDMDNFIIVVSQLSPDVENPGVNDIAKYGCLCRIKNVRNDRNGEINKVTIEVIQRAEILNLHDNENMFSTYFILRDDIIGDTKEESTMIRTFAKRVEETRNHTDLAPNILARISKGVSAGEITDIIAQHLKIDLATKQDLLETLDINTRIFKLLSILDNEKKRIEVENDVNRKVRNNIDKNQKEYYLREQLRVIKEELGDVPGKQDDADKIRKILEENPYPENIKEKILDELSHYEMMPSAAQEASMIRNYIDWMIKTPWYQKTEDQSDIQEVERILNEDHFGLEKPKQRVLEYLAVKQLTNSLKAPIICFSGPPGVGKTSLAKSIARALNRKFVKVSLGGVHDEAEIRGHRRTYLGSMPGRIIQGMKKVGVTNPVFLLDEIDKTGSDHKGDPSSALLEVLDPEQNKFFSDNYLEEAYDLSNVLFIATANYLENIPGPLRDRLEIIELSSYTEIEKLHISKEHLVKQAITDGGLKISKVEFTDEAILHIIRYYTREAGVRELGRNLSAICRKIAIDVLKNNVKVKKKVTISIVKEFLGVEKYDYNQLEKTNQIGVATGLAYTQFGGDILPVEVNYFKGKGNFIITGNLGDVMKESASIALDYIRANAEKYGINHDIFENNTVHIHFPEGAIPKDGPSAGITMTTAIISALSKCPVRRDLAMTGEVTLRGNVLPIGGLREKSIAAHRSGMKIIIIPKGNDKNLDEIPAIVKENMEIILASNVDEVLKYALVP